MSLVAVDQVNHTLKNVEVYSALSHTQSNSGADPGGVDRVTSHPPSLVVLCNVVLETFTIVIQPPPLHQHSLLWVATLPCKISGSVPAIQVKDRQPKQLKLLVLT